MIELVGYAGGCFGLGHNIRAISKGLELAGIPHRIFPIVVPGHNFEIVGMPNAPLVNENEKEADITIYCFHHEKPTRGKKKYCLVAWETEVIPHELARILQKYDGLFCISPFVQDVLRKHGFTSEVLLIPGEEMEVIPRETAREQLQDILSIPKDAFMVLFIFDFASTIQRKNPDGGILAFEYAFSSNENAIFVIKSINAKHYPNSAKTLQEYLNKFSQRIIWIDQCLSRENLTALYNACDVYLSLHRSEGWGLTIFEAMTIGKPVVVTGYSGNLAFNNKDNACLVSHRVRKEASDVHIYKNAKWVEADTFHAAFHLYRLYCNPIYRRSLGERGRDAVQQISYPRLADTLRGVFFPPPTYIMKLPWCVRGGPAPGIGCDPVKKNCGENIPPHPCGGLTPLPMPSEPLSLFKKIMNTANKNNPSPHLV